MPAEDTSFLDQRQRTWSLPAQPGSLSFMFALWLLVPQVLWLCLTFEGLSSFIVGHKQASPAFPLEGDAMILGGKQI